MNLKQKTITGTIWSFIDRVGNSLIQLLLTIILARLLDPKDFGVIGMLIIFSSISRIIFDGRNQYNAFNLESKGFEYYQIGKQ